MANRSEKCIQKSLKKRREAPRESVHINLNPIEYRVQDNKNVELHTRLLKNRRKKSCKTRYVLSSTLEYRPMNLFLTVPHSLSVLNTLVAVRDDYNR